MRHAAEEIRAAVEQRFAQVARSPERETKFPVGPNSARKLGYDPQEIDALPTSVTESFCGVGNPLGLGEVGPGQTVLDLGSGPGLDSLLAARRVGQTGKVVGVDLCPEMIDKARRNADLLGLHNVEFVNAGIEKLPLPDASMDVVISNTNEAAGAVKQKGSVNMATSYTHFSDLAKEVQSPEQGILSRTLFSDDRLKAVLFAFAQGEELSEHTASMPAVLHFLQGEAKLTLGDDTVAASPGSWVHMPRGLRHSIQAQTPVVMLLLLLK